MNTLLPELVCVRLPGCTLSGKSGIWISQGLKDGRGKVREVAESLGKV